MCVVVTDKEDEGDVEDVVASVSTIDGVRRRHSADIVMVVVVAISIIRIAVDWLHSTSGAWRIIIIIFFLGWQ